MVGIAIAGVARQLRIEGKPWPIHGWERLLVLNNIWTREKQVSLFGKTHVHPQWFQIENWKQQIDIHRLVEEATGSNWSNSFSCKSSDRSAFEAKTVKARGKCALRKSLSTCYFSVQDNTAGDWYSNQQYQLYQQWELPFYKTAWWFSTHPSVGRSCKGMWKL